MLYNAEDIRKGIKELLVVHFALYLITITIGFILRILKSLNLLLC